jgi:hypothetical protein
MGRQMGPVHMSGKHGDTVFFIGADGYAGFRRAAPPSRKKIKEDANYALTRKNNAEFAGAAVAAHSIRLCMGETVRRYADRRLTSRLLAICRGIINRGPGFGGERTFAVGPNVNSLRTLELHKREPLGGRFMAPITVTPNAGRNVAVLDVPAFNTDAYLTRPQGATHFKLLLVAGVLSDHAFVGGEEVYAPVDADINGMSVVAVSAVLPAINSVTTALQLTATVPGSPVMTSTSYLMVSVGIEFYRVVNNYEELFADGNAMRVVGVY